ESRADLSSETVDTEASRHPRQCSPGKTEIHGCDGHKPDKASGHTGWTERSRDSLCDTSRSLTQSLSPGHPSGPSVPDCPYVCFVNSEECCFDWQPDSCLTDHPAQQLSDFPS